MMEIIWRASCIKNLFDRPRKIHTEFIKASSKEEAENKLLQYNMVVVTCVPQTKVY